MGIQKKTVANRIDQYNRSVKNKFNLYNSLFLDLPYSDINATGTTIPLLSQVIKRELKLNKKPVEILGTFFKHTLDIDDEQEQIDYMFRVIQFVERQVVLFDSVEDAAFSELNSTGEYVRVKDLFRKKNLSEEVRVKTLEKINNFSARIVFTAHPTQFYPPSVLEIMKRLRLSVNENNIEEVDQLLRQLGMTSLLNSKQPTPIDEAKNIIYYLRTVYYDAIASLYGKVKEQFSDDQFDNPKLISLGFWPGGDRDGNPFVTADVTKKVADELRVTIAKCYYNNIKDLQTKVTFKGVDEELSKVRSLLYEAMFDYSVNLPLEAIQTCIENARKLVVEKYQNLYLEEIDNFIDKLAIFKSHFASLDIRQDHSIHLQLITEILIQNGKIKESISELSKADLVSILSEEILNVEGLTLSHPTLEDTLVNIKQLKAIQASNGIEGCHRYIISNSEDINSVLFVYALFRWSGYAADQINFDIVPLFETMIGMEESSDIMRELFDFSFYADHLKRRNTTQTIMLGFSDGTKDGGYLKANWSIFRTKERLSAICKDRDYDVIFFDGRGGPPARGGGKTHRFYASQGKNITTNEIHLTIQGQTITSTYGTMDQFKHNCEQMITAGISDNSEEISEENRSLIEELATESYNKYLALKNHDKFLDYLENKSTLRYYKKAKIGSRPGKRGNKAKLELKDLRAISFVGSWSQLKQNVPGYFGIGSALKAMKDSGRLPQVKKLYKEASFFRALLLNSMMSLTKCYFELTSYIKDDPEYAAFWQVLNEEYELTIELLLEISGFESLMEEEPLSKQSILMREHIVLPLLLIQQYALQQISKGSEYKDLYDKIVVRSLYGNINASRNSA